MKRTYRQLLVFTLMTIYWFRWSEGYSVGSCVQTSGAVNIRSAPTTSASIYFTTTAGEKLTIRSGTPTSADGYLWNPVTARTYNGWVADSLVTACPGSSNGGTIPQIQWKAGDCVTSGGANFRSSPSISASVVFVTNSGETLTVGSASPVAPGDGYTWVPVTGRSTSGWMAASVLSSCPTTGGSGSSSGGSNSGTAGSRCKYTLYKQSNPLWSSNKLGYCSDETIGSAGCAMTSVTMALSAFGKTYTPPDVNAYLKSHSGFSNGQSTNAGCLIVWGAITGLGLPSAPTRTTSMTPANLKSLIDNCQPVVAAVDNFAHWVLVTGAAGYPTSFEVNDPGYPRPSYAFSRMCSWVIFPRP